MGRPKRDILATADETSTPPNTLSQDELICKVHKAAGNNLFNVSNVKGQILLVELPAHFRSTFWIKRGGYVLVNMAAFEERDNKLDGEITNVVRDEKEWRKMSYWPGGFKKKGDYGESDDDEGEEESVVGKMPPSDSDEE
ncbi:nucleic acid-binding protein [Tothia fuscella]|uniref:Nucleic acid-binding protein n=1 Tax=Tothia fuscella TaxID=1048955 RepID=A0A9P4NN85_9PEZI|nr:nucleic acid-binding protein [Tothia fuscella]